MKLRKLIRADVLRDMHADVKRGVPVALAMRKYLPENSMTRPTVVKLLAANNAIDSSLACGNTSKAEHIVDSLFPTWLDEVGDAVQTEPHGYSYHGMFPLGRWLCAT
jgi:hypothetical protein